MRAIENNRWILRHQHRMSQRPSIPMAESPPPPRVTSENQQSEGNSATKRPYQLTKRKAISRLQPAPFLTTLALELSVPDEPKNQSSPPHPAYGTGPGAKRAGAHVLIQNSPPENGHPDRSARSGGDSAFSSAYVATNVKLLPIKK